jgi:hypothetical protein
VAFIHSKATVITVDANDLSNYVTSSSELNKTTDTHETTAYGLDDKRYAPGLNDATFSMEGTYDSTASTGPRAVLNGIYAGNVAVEIVRQPEGVGASLPQDVFDAILTSYVETAPVGDMVSWSAEFQVTGGVDTTAQSA